VLDAIKRLFGDESGAQLTDTDIIRWINEGQLEIARKTNYTATASTTPSVAGQEAYLFAGINILAIKTLSYNGYYVECKTFEQVQNSYLNTIGPSTIPTVLNTSMPIVWYEYDDSIYLWPPPTVAGDTIKLFYSTLPTVITSAVDSLSIPDTHYRALLSWIMAQAYEMDDDLQSSQIRMNQHEKTLEEVNMVVQDKVYQTITVLPEDL
jgi:hypothetical protein